MGIEATKVRPGGNIDSWCGKCKLILAHTIEAMVGDKPARVHCNTCRSQHSYRPHAPSAVSRHTREGGAIKGRTSRFQSLLKAKNTEVVKPYSPKDRYEEGDVLEHPTFGRGIATAVKDATKIEVLFETGSKTLVHGR
jgi:hypothetical protein